MAQASASAMSVEEKRDGKRKVEAEELTDTRPAPGVRAEPRVDVPSAPAPSAGQEHAPVDDPETSVPEQLSEQEEVTRRPFWKSYLWFTEVKKIASDSLKDQALNHERVHQEALRYWEKEFTLREGEWHLMVKNEVDRCASKINARTEEFDRKMGPDFAIEVDKAVKAMFDKKLEHSRALMQTELKECVKKEATGLVTEAAKANNRAKADEIANLKTQIGNQQRTINKQKVLIDEQDKGLVSQAKRITSMERTIARIEAQQDIHKEALHLCKDLILRQRGHGDPAPRNR